MKPHEETWRWGGESADHHTIFGAEGGDVVAEFEMRSPYSNEEGAEYDYAAMATKLAAAAPEMARILLELHDEHRLGSSHVPHSRSIAAVLRKAGVIADKERSNG